jgi:uncharacterized protein DUF2784
MLSGHASPLTYQLLAATVVVAHAAFVLFVVLGGLLVLRWRRVAWVHVPAAAWGVILEVADLGCPLTPVENWLRAEAGEAGYGGGFIDHYLVPVLYPASLTRTMQLALGGLALAVNALIYWNVVLARARSASGARSA